MRTLSLSVEKPRLKPRYTFQILHILPSPRSSHMPGDLGWSLLLLASCPGQKVWERCSSWSFPALQCWSSEQGRGGQMAVTSFRLTWNHGNLDGQPLFSIWVPRVAALLIKSFMVVRNNAWNGHRCTQTGSKERTMPSNGFHM